MQRRHANATYETAAVQDDEAGSIALELRRATKGSSETVARVVFWDADGQFYLQTLDDAEVALDIAEELIAEARERIRTS